MFFTMKSSMNSSLQNSFSANNSEILPKGRKSSIYKIRFRRFSLLQFDEIFWRDSILTYFSTLWIQSTLISRNFCEKIVRAICTVTRTVTHFFGKNFVKVPYHNVRILPNFSVKPIFCAKNMLNLCTVKIILLRKTNTSNSLQAYSRNPN